MIKTKIRKMILGYRATSESYFEFLREKGAKIGCGCTLYSPDTTNIDIQFPWMLEIGDEVRITKGVTILNHDYSWSVWKYMTGEIVGGVGGVKIGNNVFIGMNATILMNTEIGDNVIIGANSLVSGKVESNSVYAGNPAKRIMSVEEYMAKRKNRQLNDAKKIVQQYYLRFGKKPTENNLPAYFWLWKNDKNKLTPQQINRMNLCGNYEQSIETFANHKPEYNNFDEFVDCCLEEIK